MKERDYRLLNCTCPWCGSKTDAATSIDHPDIRPKLGDFSICVNCFHVGRFTESPLGLDLCRLELEEFKSLPQKNKNQIVTAVRAALRARQERIHRN